MTLFELIFSLLTVVNIEVKNLNSIIHKSPSGRRRNLKEHQCSKWSEEFTEVTFCQLIENNNFSLPTSLEASSVLHLLGVFLCNDKY